MTTYEIKHFDHYYRDNSDRPTWRAWVDTLEEAEEAIRDHLTARIEAERRHVWATIDAAYLDYLDERTLEEIIREETEILATWQTEAASPKEAMTEPLDDLEDCAADLELAAAAAYAWTIGAGIYIVEEAR